MPRACQLSTYIHRHLKGPLEDTKSKLFLRSTSFGDIFFCFFNIMTSVALLPLEMLSNTFFFLSRNICSRDLSGWCSGQSHDSSGVTKQHATHAWWYTVVGVVVRCFVGDSNGRTVSNFVMNCGAASLLDHQNCCCGGGADFRDGGRFPFDVLQSRSSLQNFRCLCLSSNLVCGMLVLSYLCIYLFFSLLD